MVVERGGPNSERRRDLRQTERVEAVAIRDLGGPLLTLTRKNPVPTGGNGDAYLNPGESVRLDLSLANLGGRAAADSILEIGTVLLRQMAVSEILIGLLVALGASLIGPARYAKWVRGYSARGFRSAAVATWVGFAVVILAVIAWTPIIAASSWLTFLIVLILVVVGIEAIRRTSLAEEATLLESEAAIEVAHADASTDES